MSPKDLKVHQLTNSKELHAYKVLERARKRKRESTSAHLQTCIILQQPEDLYGWRMATTFTNCRYRKVISLPFPSMTVASLHTVGDGCRVPLPISKQINGFPAKVSHTRLPRGRCCACACEGTRGRRHEKGHCGTKMYAVAMKGNQMIRDKQ